MTAHRTRHTATLLAIVCMTLAGCAGLTRTTYTRPETSLPAAWQHDNTQPSAPQSPWWQAYGDPQLNQLVQEALDRNADLAAAAIKLRRARLNAGLTEDKLIPSLSATGDSSASKSLKGSPPISRSYSAKVAISYEVDLWNKLGAARDAAEWEALATEQDKASTTLSLIGSAARLYWQIGYLNQRITLADQSIAYTEKTLELVQVKYRAGSVSMLDVLQAQQDLASQRASRTQLVQQREEARTSFALLFGGAPSKEFAEPQTLPDKALPAVEAELPASLLGRRPDLRAAELRLRGTLATADSTRTSYYPSLSLTGAVGSSSTRLKDVLQNPVASLATELALPFLQYREMKLKTGISQADYDLAVVQFRQSLYTALGDVENALSARQQYLAQGELLAESFKTAQAVEKINETRYRAGAIPLQTWLDAQEKRRTAESSLAENRYNLLASQITLNLALGGDTKADAQ